MHPLYRASRLASITALIWLAWSAHGIGHASEHADYVGSDACAGCHPATFRTWSHSHHARAMQPATPSTVLGNFSDARFAQNGVVTTFSRQADAFQIRTEGADGSLHDYRVAYTFGVAPLQQYLIPLTGGRLQAFGIAWNSRPQAEGGQRWYSLYPDQPPHPGDRVHWTGRDQTWNFQCAACHSTDVRKNFDLASDTYATTSAQTGVGCEACHGPGAHHLAWARTRTNDPRKGLSVQLTAADHGTWRMDPRTGIARRLDPPSGVEIDACGSCHARRSVIADGTTAATPFLDAYLPALLEPGLYHADGQIDGEVFEYGSFVQSRMYHAGVTCTNCHTPHAATLRAHGNALCAQCHLPARFDTPEHHHHKAGGIGAQCIECHMPAKTYMGVDRRRDHSFRVPRPDLTVRIGVPNTCGQCHPDKPADWAANAVARWFPAGRQTTGHYGLALQAGRSGAADAEAQLDALIRDETAPAIARATALHLLGPYATAASEPVVVASAGDSKPLLRLGAAAALSALPSPDAAQAVVGLLSDPVRAVRIEAARALADIGPNVLTPAQRDAFDAASKELVASEMVNADRPEAHLNLGLIAVRRGQQDEAEKQYQTALRLDPAFVPALVNLADLDRMRAMDAQGAALLQRAVAIAPRNAEAHHALGLLLVRRHDPAAITELRQASELAPENARYAYVYAVALQANGAVGQALVRLTRAHEQHPADRDILTALISIAQQQGDRAMALRYARQLAALTPDDAEVRQLVEQLAASP